MLGILLPKVILEISMQRDKVQALLKITTKTADQTKKTKSQNLKISISCCVFEIILLCILWIQYQTPSMLERSAVCFEV